MNAHSSHIRPAQVADAPALARICLLTGDAGADATGLYGDDTVLADVYATPYLYGPGCFAFVWDEGAGALGYVLGARDTHAFQDWFSNTWWPSVADAHPMRTDADEKVLRDAANASRMIEGLEDILAAFPAHLHIDLVPEAQGKGAGRALIEEACDLLSRDGVAGVHLGIDPRNHGARAFYPRVGFTADRGDRDLFVRALR